MTAPSGSPPKDALGGRGSYFLLFYFLSFILLIAHTSRDVNDSWS